MKLSKLCIFTSTSENMRTVTVDILQDEALNLLKDLEALNVIRLHDSKKKANKHQSEMSAKYKGAMSKQSRAEVDQQLDDLRKEWN
jgi:hypothetical protein